MEGKASYYPWTVSSLAQTGHHNLLTFLAAAQGKEVDILPITWQGDLNFIGHGGTADLSQSAVDIYTSFAFKRMRLGQDDRAIEKANFDMLTAEMMAYTHPTIVGHPNISQLEGFCWEIGPDNSQLLPVLVFREADFGDMEKFMKTDRGQSSSLQERIKWCAELAKALQVLHENGDSSRSRLMNSD
jgi:serine/threonine protein kinase